MAAGERSCSRCNGSDPACFLCGGTGQGVASDAVSDVLAEVLRLRAAIRDAVSLIEIDRYFAARDRLEDALAGIPRAADVTEGEGG